MYFQFNVNLRPIASFAILLSCTASLIAATQVSHAAPVTIRGLTLADTQTGESKISYNGNIGAQYNFAFFEFTKDGGAEKQGGVLKVEHGALQGTFYFYDGAGKYQLRLFATSENQAYGVNFRWIANFEVTNTDPRNLEYLLPTTMAQSDDPQIISTAKTIVANASANNHVAQLSPKEQSLAVHDWVANYLTYDLRSTEDQTYLNQPHDAVSAFNRKTGVCSDFSTLTTALLRALGIKARVISGFAIQPEMGESWADLDPDTSPTHAWNEVFLDGIWSPVDVTWDAGAADSHTHVWEHNLVHTFFFPQLEFFTKSHQASRVTAF